MERKIHFRENWLIFWGIWGEAELISRILEAKEKYFQGAEEFSFRDLGRSMHYFQRSWEHRPLGATLNPTSSTTLEKNIPSSSPSFCLGVVGGGNLIASV